MFWGKRHTPQATAGTDCERLVQSAMRALGSDWRAFTPTHLRVSCKPLFGHWIDLHAHIEEPFVDLTTFTGLACERDKLPREVLLVMLEQNDSKQIGSFCLRNHRNLRMVAQTLRINARGMAPPLVEKIAQTIIHQTTTLIERLVTSGVIDPGRNRDDDRRQIPKLRVFPQFQE